MANKAVKIAVVGGSGLIGKRHCQHVVDCDDTQLVAIVDPSTTAISVAQLHSVPLYRSINDLLNSSDRPQAAIVCTPNHTHVSIGIELARAGIHILCEKPISHELEGARQLIREADFHRVHLLIGHHRRFNPYVVAMKQILDSGVLGEVSAVNGLWVAMKPAEYFEGVDAQWRQKREKGGGVILINFIHEIDLMQYFFGPVTRIHAEAVMTRRSSDANAVEEGAAITMRFATGIVGTFLISDNASSQHNFEMGTGENPQIPKAGKDAYRVFGSRGTLSFPEMSISEYEDSVQPSWGHKMETSAIHVKNIELLPLGAQLQHFASVCRGEEPPRCTGLDGLRALAACQAVREALGSPDRGGTIKIEML